MTRPRHRHVRPSRSVVVVAVMALGVLLGGGTAAAYWTGSAAGSGTASSGTAARVVLTPGTPTPTLFPGGSADVTLVISNPGTSTVTVAILELDVTRAAAGFAVDAAHAGCDTGVLAFQAQDNAGAGWTVPGRGALDVTLADAVTMTVDAANSCQGAHFTVSLLAAS